MSQVLHRAGLSRACVPLLSTCELASGVEVVEVEALDLKARIIFGDDGDLTRECPEGVYDNVFGPAAELECANDWLRLHNETLVFQTVVGGWGNIERVRDAGRRSGDVVELRGECQQQMDRGYVVGHTLAL